MTELDCGEYAKQKVCGMNFTIRRFYAAGLGSVSSMVASGFFGLMKMDTLLGDADLSLLEKAKETAKELPEHDLGEHWYDSIKLAISLSKKGIGEEKTAMLFRKILFATEV